MIGKQQKGERVGTAVSGGKGEFSFNNTIHFTIYCASAIFYSTLYGCIAQVPQSCLQVVLLYQLLFELDCIKRYENIICIRLFHDIKSRLFEFQDIFMLKI